MLSRMRIRVEQFVPGWLGLLVNPFFIARRGLYLGIKELAPYLGESILDVGCGTKPYQKIFNFREYIGMEIESARVRGSAKADIYYLGGSFPFSSARFDSVISSEVLEHIFEPDLFLSEIHRVLKTGGHLLLTVPFIWDEHEEPVDYARYTSMGLAHLLRKHGFEILNQKKSICDGRLFFQLVNLCIYKRSMEFRNIFRLPVLITLTSIVNLLGVGLGWLFPRNTALYLDNIVLARKDIP